MPPPAACHSLSILFTKVSRPARRLSSGFCASAGIQKRRDASRSAQVAKNFINSFLVSYPSRTTGVLKIEKNPIPATLILACLLMIQGLVQVGEDVGNALHTNTHPDQAVGDAIFYSLFLGNAVMGH